jgi:hypothetical protein
LKLAVSLPTGSEHWNTAGDLVTGPVRRPLTHPEGNNILSKEIPFSVSVVCGLGYHLCIDLMLSLQYKVFQNSIKNHRKNLKFVTAALLFSGAFENDGQNVAA